MHFIHPIRVYADTSVFGGLYDEAFANASNRFFDLVESGRFKLIVSPVVEDEIANAPSHIREAYASLSRLADTIAISPEVTALQSAYLDAGIITPKSSLDALHVAAATVSHCSLIISWNFKHIVHFQKIPMYNGVDKMNGYGEIGIHSPQEVIEDGTSYTNTRV